MNAPDKIYTDNRGVYATLPIFSQKDANVEYIRKDTLLEWAKDLKYIYEISVNNHQTSKLCCAKAKALQIVIDKIESL